MTLSSSEKMFNLRQEQFRACFVLIIGLGIYKFF
jgi:hypothetical protein